MESRINIEAFNCIFYDISASMQPQVQVSEIANLVLRKAVEVLKAKGAVIRTLNPHTNQLDLAVAYGMSDRYLSKGPVSWDKVIRDLCKYDEVRIIDNIFDNPCIQYPRELWEEGVRMISDAPLILRDKVIGMLRIYFSEKKRLSVEELNFLLFTSRQGACAINEAGLIEKQRNEYERLARQTEKMAALGRMAAGIAHEINNPLAGILLYSSSLIKKVPEQGLLREGLEVIIRETKRCKTIIQELLEFSRVTEPKRTLSNINEIIERALSILTNEFRLRHIHVEKHLSDQMEQILLDEKQVQQVFINLLMNSVEAIEKEGVITIRSWVDRSKELVKVEIADSGAGIPEEHLPKIFEPFYSTKANGTGLGLSVSYRIIQNHTGNIQVSSRPGEGTCFIVDFPLPQNYPAKGTGDL